MRDSIHGRLTTLIVTTTAVMLCMTALGLDFVLRTKLEQEFDLSLLAKARLLVTLTTQANGKITFDFADEFMPEFEAPQHPEYFQLWMADGALIERSHSLGDGALPRLDPAEGVPDFSQIALPDGRKGRLVTVKFRPHFKDAHEDEAPGSEATPQDQEQLIGGPQALFAVARGREELDALISAVRGAIALAMSILLGAIVIAIPLALRQGLRPLEQIGLHMQTLQADTLSAHTPLTTTVRELVPITGQVNSLVARLGEAFQRERRFSGDVAHELRTPLAELRALAEIGGKWPEDQKMVAAFFNDVVDVTEDMERIVTSLLTLARCDAGRELVDPQIVSLGEILQKSWARMAVKAREKGITLAASGSTLIRLRTDPTKLELILTNLFSNAVEYSPPDTQVSVRVIRRQDHVDIMVSNVTDCLAIGDLPLLFDRFWRKDHVRARGHHAGLGLSLVKALADLLCVRVSLQLKNECEFQVTLSGHGLYAL